MRYEWSDARLVEGLRERSDAAAQEFINTYSAPLYHYLRRRCRCEEDANDVLSMVFQKVVSSIHTFRAELGSFKNWLYLVARTCLVDFFRDESSVFGDDLPLPPDDQLPGEGLSEGPWKYLLEEGPEEGESRLTRAVQEIFARMRPGYVEVLQLAHTDLTREEIADLLDVTRANLRVRIKRASDQFKELALEHPIIGEWLARAEPLPEPALAGE